MHPEMMSSKVFSKFVDTTVQLYCYNRMIRILNIKYISDQQLGCEHLENPNDQKSNVVQTDLPLLNFLFPGTFGSQLEDTSDGRTWHFKTGKKAFRRILAQLPRVAVVTRILRGRGCWLVFAYTCEVLGGIGSTIR